MGHDLGTVWATGLADLLKKDLNGLILINGLSLSQFKKRLNNPHQLIKSWYMFLMQLPWVPEKLMERYPSSLLKIPYYLKQNSFLADKNGLGHFWQYRTFFKELIKSPHHPFIEAPTLVLWGSHDAFLVVPQLDEFKNEFKEVEIRILEGDHWFHLNQTDKVINLLERFIGGKNEYLGKAREKNFKAG
jgi:pimeloyl-ACP methyl ester carboxylesterase